MTCPYHVDHGLVIDKTTKVKFVQLTKSERAAKRAEEAAKKAEEAAKEEEEEQEGEP